MSKKIKDARMWVFVLLSFFGTLTQQLAMLSTVDKISGIMWALALSTCLSATAGAVWAYWTDAPQAKTPRSIKLDPPDLRSGCARLDALAMLGIVGMLAALLLTGCGTVMPKVQDKADALAARAPYGPALLSGFRTAEGERSGMVKLPDDAVTETLYVDNAGAPLTNGVRAVTTIRYERPLVPSAIAPVPTPTPGVGNELKQQRRTAGEAVMPTPLERDLIALVKLARRKDIRPQFAALRDLHGAATVAAKLDQCFSPEGARELLMWLNEADAPEKPKPAPEPPAPAGAVLRGVSVRGSKMGLDYVVPSDWPRKTSKGKTINAMLCINGRKVDWLKAPMQNEKTMGNLYDDPDFFQGIRRGQTVEVSIKDIHGKRESNRAPFVWPWKDTP